jgi:hypothetical protein
MADKICYNCGKAFPEEQYIEGAICPNDDCNYDDRDVKREDLGIDYKRCAYTLYAGKVQLMRDLEEVSEDMLKAFLLTPLVNVRDRYSIICSQVRHGDGGYWERDDEVAYRHWRDFDMTEEVISMQSGSIDRMIARLLREMWMSKE